MKHPLYDEMPVRSDRDIERELNVMTRVRDNATNEEIRRESNALVEQLLREMVDMTV